MTNNITATQVITAIVNRFADNQYTNLQSEIDSAKECLSAIVKYESTLDLSTLSDSDSVNLIQTHDFFIQIIEHNTQLIIKDILNQ